MGQVGVVPNDLPPGGSASADPRADLGASETPTDSSHARGNDTAADRWKDTARCTALRIKQHRVSVSAGSLAYHGFLAFFPAIIAALGILTLLHIGTGTVHDLTRGIDKALPAGASGVVKAAVKAATKRSSGTLGAVIVGILVALWSSSSAMAVLQQTLDVAYDVASDRKFLARRVRGVGLMALTVAFGGCAAALIVFGEPIGRAVDSVVPVGGTAFDVGWTAVRWVVAVALVAVLFSAYYSLAPNKASRWRWLSPGSVVASVLFLVASLGFSFYISTFGSYGKTYGSFAGVAIFIFWLYLTGFAVLLGGELNAAISAQGASRAEPEGQGRGPGVRRGSATTARGRSGAAAGADVATRQRAPVATAGAAATSG